MEKKTDRVEAGEKAARNPRQRGLDGEPSCPPRPRLRIAPEPLPLLLSLVGFLVEAFILVGYLLFDGAHKVWGRVFPSGHR